MRADIVVTLSLAAQRALRHLCLTEESCHDNRFTHEIKTNIPGWLFRVRVVAAFGVEIHPALTRASWVLTLSALRGFKPTPTAKWSRDVTRRAIEVALRLLPKGDPKMWRVEESCVVVIQPIADEHLLLAKRHEATPEAWT